jgi:cyclophilin family peptidyl-prolyl cis-trans isomerase/HEAT repeat protein
MKLFLIAFCLVGIIGNESAARGLDPIVVAEDARNVNAKALKDAILENRSEVRERVALAYGRIRKSEGIDPLLGLLLDKSERVQRAAAFALGQLGWEVSSAGGREKEISDALVACAQKSTDALVKASAIEALGKIGLEETPRLVMPFFKNSSALVKAEAVFAIFRHRQVLKNRKPDLVLPDVSQAVFDALQSVARDTSVEVRKNVAYFFARNKDVRGIDLLQTLSEDREPLIRYFSVLGLGKISDLKILDVLVKRASDSNYNVRVAAVQAVGILKSAQHLPKSVAIDSEYHVREAYAAALGASDQSDEQILVSLSKDKSPSVQMGAYQGLIQRRKDTSKDLIRQMLRFPSWTLREAAVTSIAHLSTDKELLLQLAVKDGDVRVRNAALTSLGEIETPSAYSTITAALRSELLSERGTAIGLMASRKEADRTQLAWTVYSESSGVKWNEIRESVVDVLATEVNAATTGQLVQILKDPSLSVARKALKTLEERGVANLPSLPPVAQTHSPYKELEFRHNPIVVFETTRGTMTVATYPEVAQIHVANFVGLVKKGFYDGLLWHRVVPNFVIQGGDADGTGWGDAGYQVRAEINPLRFKKGTLGMPRGADFDSGGVQVFFNHVPTPHLDGLYTVFGQVVSGLDVLDRIEKGDVILKAYVK